MGADEVGHVCAHEHMEGLGRDEWLAGMCARASVKACAWECVSMCVHVDVRVWACVEVHAMMCSSTLLCGCT